MTTQAGSTQPTPVYLEVGKKRVFACALEWPGWCRSGKTEEQALEALAAYAERYAVVAREAGVPFPGAPGNAFHVVERLPGSATTDFGAPGEVATSDRDPLTGEEAERQTALVRASWSVLDRVAAAAPAELRKGPRGGGRDRDRVIEHVLGAEAAYARTLGVKHRQPAHDDRPAIAALRDDIIAALRGGAPPAPKGWPPRYAARRIAWHVLDHAWEIEDRTEPAR
jgi:predicted RNase H-like HicB family nuclease